MVEAELALLEVQLERLLRQPVELGEASLGEAPEAFDAVDVVGAVGPMIVAVADAQVAGIAQVDEAVVAGQAIRQDRAVQCDTPTDHGLEGDGAAVGHDLGIDAVAAFEHAEDDGLLVGPSAAFATHALRAKERFVDFDLAAERRLPLAVFGDAAPDEQEDPVDRSHAQAGEVGGRRGGQIESEAPHQGPKPGLADLRTPEVPVFLSHVRKLAAAGGCFAS